jgi:hypothetical protein
MGQGRSDRSAALGSTRTRTCRELCSRPELCLRTQEAGAGQASLPDHPRCRSGRRHRRRNCLCPNSTACRCGRRASARTRSGCLASVLVIFLSRDEISDDDGYSTRRASGGQFPTFPPCKAPPAAPRSSSRRGDMSGASANPPARADPGYLMEPPPSRRAGGLGMNRAAAHLLDPAWRDSGHRRVTKTGIRCRGCRPDPSGKPLALKSTDPHAAMKLRVPVAHSLTTSARRPARNSCASNGWCLEAYRLARS